MLVPGSPSSQRAWIEIPNRGPPEANDQVALLAEGVDRNSKTHTNYDIYLRLKPR